MHFAASTRRYISWHAQWACELLLKLVEDKETAEAIRVMVAVMPAAEVGADAANRRTNSRAIDADESICTCRCPDQADEHDRGASCWAPIVLKLVHRHCRTVSTMTLSGLR